MSYLLERSKALKPFCFDIASVAVNVVNLCARGTYSYSMYMYICHYRVPCILEEMSINQ